MKSVLLLLCLALPGCMPVATKAAVKPVVPTPSPFKPDVEDKIDSRIEGVSVQAETKGSITDVMAMLLGPGGTLTWESDNGQPHNIETNGTRIALTSGTKIKFDMSETGGMFTFQEPSRPVASVNKGLFRLKAPLVSVLFKPSGTEGVATADLGFTKKQFPFKIDITPTDEGYEEPAADVQRKRPTVYCYTTPGCGPCEQAKREIRAAGDLGFEVTFTDDGPAWATRRPWFHWSTKSGWMRAKNPGWMGVPALKQLVESTQDSAQALASARLGANSVHASEAINPQGPIWSYSGGESKSSLIDHLLTDGIHRGRYSKSYLSSLSQNQLVLLHSRDHNTTGRNN